MFSSLYGCMFYRVLFSKARFEFLLRAIRFDDQATRQARLRTDKFCDIRELCDSVMVNCRNNWEAGQFVTVDEQLVPFRGRCPFRMYIANKPAKYGIKLFMVADAEHFYCINAIPYTGQGSVPQQYQVRQNYILIDNQ